jgi:hypothetical protein
MTTRPGYIWSGTEWVEIGQSAVIAPISYQASAPSTPATGDIWIDSDDEVPSVDSTLYYRWTKTMSGGETSLSGTDNNSLSLQYTPGYESVFINGVLQVRNLDYTATSGSTISGLTALASNDVVMVESIIAYSVGDTYTQSTSDIKFNAGYRYLTTLYYTSTGTFTKASYPNIRAIVVKCQGAGGGGGGTTATTSGQFAAGAGGGGGAYSEKLITDIVGLASSVTVTVGTGSSGVSTGTATQGGSSSFGSLASAVGGYGGQTQGAQTFWITTGPGNGGDSGVGDLVIQGAGGESGNPVNTNGGYGGRGGDSQLGTGARSSLAWQSASNGFNGNLYGGGGGGAAATQNSSLRTGGNGASGIVIVELYA